MLDKTASKKFMLDKNSREEELLSAGPCEVF